MVDMEARQYEEQLAKKKLQKKNKKAIDQLDESAKPARSCNNCVIF
jgi:hypothetical protein